LDRKPNPRIAVWGLAYKQDTHSIKNSASLELLRALPNCRIQAHDPAAAIPANDFPHVKICNTPLEALEGADALLVMTPWKIYGAIPVREIKSHLKGGLVIDPYATLDELACRAASLDFHRLGC
jgi:UDPglucose 6-dehydrogenase